MIFLGIDTKYTFKMVQTSFEITDMYVKKLSIEGIVIHNERTCEHSKWKRNSFGGDRCIKNNANKEQR